MFGCNGMIIGLKHYPGVIEADFEEAKMRSSHRVLILSSKSEQIFSMMVILRWMTQFYCRWPALIKMMSVVKVVDSHQTSRTKKQKVAPNGVAELESKSPTAWFLQQNFHLTRPWGIASKSIYGDRRRQSKCSVLEEFHPASEISRRTRRSHENDKNHEGI